MVRLNIDTNAGPSSIRIGFTDQRLTAHDGMIVWSHFLQQQQFRHQFNSVLPHTPTSPNAFAPADIALGFLGGILPPGPTSSPVWRGCKAIRPWPRSWASKRCPVSPR